MLATYSYKISQKKKSLSRDFDGVNYQAALDEKRFITVIDHHMIMRRHIK